MPDFILRCEFVEEGYSEEECGAWAPYDCKWVFSNFEEDQVWVALCPRHLSEVAQEVLCYRLLSDTVPLPLVGRALGQKFAPYDHSYALPLKGG